MNAQKIVTFSLSLLCLLGIAGASAMEQPEKPGSLKAIATQAIYKNSIAPLLKDVTAENIDQTYDDIMKKITELKNELPKELVKYFAQSFNPSEEFNDIEDLVARKLVSVVIHKIWQKIDCIGHESRDFNIKQYLDYSKKITEIAEQIARLMKSKTLSLITLSQEKTDTDINANDDIIRTFMQLEHRFKQVPSSVTELPKIKSVIGNTLGFGTGIALSSAGIGGMAFMDQKLGLGLPKALLINELIFTPIYTITLSTLKEKYGENAVFYCNIGTILLGFGYLLKNLHNK